MVQMKIQVQGIILMDSRFEDVPIGGIFTYDKITYKKISESTAQYLDRKTEEIEFDDFIIVKIKEKK